MLVPASTPPPPWIQRAAIPPPIIAWRLADVLGTPVVEGIAVDRDVTAGTLTVNVVDSRFNPPRVVKIRDVKGTLLTWLRAGTKDGLLRSQIAIGTETKGKQTAYLLQVGKPLELKLVRTVHGTSIASTVFSH